MLILTNTESCEVSAHLTLHEAVTEMLLSTNRGCELRLKEKITYTLANGEHRVIEVEYTEDMIQDVIQDIKSLG